MERLFDVLGQKYIEFIWRVQGLLRELDDLEGLYGGDKEDREKFEQIESRDLVELWIFQKVLVRERFGSWQIFIFDVVDFELILGEGERIGFQLIDILSCFIFIVLLLGEMRY